MHTAAIHDHAMITLIRFELHGEVAVRSSSKETLSHWVEEHNIFRVKGFLLRFQWQANASVFKLSAPRLDRYFDPSYGNQKKCVKHSWSLLVKHYEKEKFEGIL